MGKSEAYEDIMPAIRENQTKNTYVSRYLALPDNIVDILIDAAEPYFMGKGYNQPDVARFCKKYLKNNSYTFIGNEPIINKVVSYFSINRTHIATARAVYPELLADVLLTGEDIESLPGGICNKVRYILALEHYRINQESIVPGENQE